MDISASVSEVATTTNQPKNKSRSPKDYDSCNSMVAVRAPAKLPQGTPFLFLLVI
jgi:hypothetical protein